MYGISKSPKDILWQELTINIPFTFFTRFLKKNRTVMVMHGELIHNLGFFSISIHPGTLVA